MIKKLIAIVLLLLAFGAFFHSGMLYHGMACVYQWDRIGQIEVGKYMGYDYAKCSIWRTDKIVLH